MRGRDFSFSMEFNGHRFDGSVLMCFSSGRTDQWLIDVPSVLWILERVAVGDVDARTVQDRLRQPRSGTAAAVVSVTVPRRITRRLAAAMTLLLDVGSTNRNSLIRLFTPIFSTKERSTD